jgi:hypothetical protein
LTSVAATRARHCHRSDRRSIDLGEDAVSFLQKAKEAAAQAAEQARVAASQVGDQAKVVGSQVGEQARVVGQKAQDPVAQARAKRQAAEALGKARRGVNTMVERIDPGTLADLIIKSTALQEMTNRALKKKGSPYRIQEIVITASIPPGVSFSIGRVHDEDAHGQELVSSVDLVEESSLADEAIVSLDGTEVSTASLDKGLWRRGGAGDEEDDDDYDSYDPAPDES